MRPITCDRLSNCRKWLNADKLRDYINKCCRMLNFLQNSFKSLITFANSDDDDHACFFFVLFVFFTPHLAGVKDKAN